MIINFLLLHLRFILQLSYTLQPNKKHDTTKLL